MKKVLTIAVVAMLATSMAFAGISGYGQLGYKYDFDSKDTGFTNDTNIKVDVDVVTASAEAIAEGAVYASISGSFKLWAFNGVKGSASDDPMGGVGRFAISDIKASINGANWSLDLLGMPGRLDLAKSAIDSSTVKYEDDDYGFDKEDYSSAKSYAVSFVKAPGFGFTYNGFTAGLGFFYRDKDADAKDTKDLPYGEDNSEKATPLSYVKGTDFAAVVSTPEIAVMDGLTLQAGASYYQNETATLKTTTDKKQKGADSKKLATDRGSAFGGSLAVKYEGDTVSANVSTDLGYKIKHYDAPEAGSVPVEVKAKEKFGMDIAAQVKVSPVTVDLYYNYDGTQKEAVDANYLSAQVALDMNAFNVPMTLAIYGKDLARPVATAKPIDATATPTIFEKEMDGNKITKGTEYGIKTTVTPVDALELSASFGFNTTSVPNKIGDIKTTKEAKFFSWNASIGATYTMDVATFSGKVSMKNAGFNADTTDLEKAIADPKADSVEKAYKDAVNALVLGFEVEAKSTTLIPGAELSLKYAADDVLKSYSDAKIDADELSRLGSLTAKCKVSF